MRKEFSLPEPSEIEKNLSQQLINKIVEEIIAQGPITFARYMELALYFPSLGYYRNGLQKFGRSGDFITAPEISPLFSICMAQQCAEILDQLGGGDILEFGPGSGVMAAVILQTLQKNKKLPRHYYLLEVSAELKERQKKTLERFVPECLERVIWLDRLPESAFCGVILANEVVDAMPVHRFGFYQGIQELLIKYENNALDWVVSAPTQALTQAIAELEINFAEGYTSEINLLLYPWMKSIAHFLERGVVLITDYGMARREYYHPERRMGTFVCHYHHLVHDNIFWWPGIQDITTQVDFTAVASAAVENDLDVAGYIHQAGFLLSLGITEIVASYRDGGIARGENRDSPSFIPSIGFPDAQDIIKSQLKRLTLPQEMGEAFKAIALTKNYDFPLLGFKWMNQIERL